MKRARWRSLTKLAALLRAPPLDPIEHEHRLRAVERDMILPVKLIVIAGLVWFFYHAPWFSETGLTRSMTSVALELVRVIIVIYALLNIGVAVLLILPQRWPLRVTQWVVFAMSLIDGLFVAALTTVTGGFDSLLYWLFLGLIARNAVSVPLARAQIILHLAVILSYILAGALDVFITAEDLRLLDESTRRALEIGLPENPWETFFLRLFILLLTAACCYGAQVLIENERRAAEETRESASRQEQLRAAGRLAAEIAHKIKNPLGIINNAAFSLQRALEQGQPASLQQVRMIRQEVERADRVITEIMGYAQLAEGRVEKLNVVEEINRALQSVFPPEARYPVQIRTDFEDDLPPLLMQRNHLAEMLGNILLNAREALAGIGEVTVRAWAEDETVFISIKDTGPGVPRDKLERIFEPYFSTKDKGTGLGLAIVRHRAEMYQGKVRVKSPPGEGAEFILELPTRTFMKRRT